MLSAPMAQRLEGVCMGFLQQVTNSKGNHLRDGSWRKAAAKTVPQGAGKQPLWTYLDRIQGTVAGCVSLRPIFDDCIRDMRYGVGEKLQTLLWRQAAA